MGGMNICSTASVRSCPKVCFLFVSFEPVNGEVDEAEGADHVLRHPVGIHPRDAERVENVLQKFFGPVRDTEVD